MKFDVAPFRLKTFTSLYFAVFNCTRYSMRRGREEFIKRFGRAAWRAFHRERLASGIMGLFHRPPDNQAYFYALVVGHIADRHHARRSRP